jgi:hypothetical protein
MEFANKPTEETAFRYRKRYPFIGASGPVAACNPESQWFSLEHDAVSKVLWNDTFNTDSPTTDLCDEVVRQGTAKYARVGFSILSGQDRKLFGSDDVNQALHVVSVSLRLARMPAETRHLRTPSALHPEKSAPTGTAQGRNRNRVMFDWGRQAGPADATNMAEQIHKPIS